MSEFEIELGECVVDPVDVDWSTYSDARLLESVKAGTREAIVEAEARGLI